MFSGVGCSCRLLRVFVFIMCWSSCYRLLRAVALYSVLVAFGKSFDETLKGLLDELFVVCWLLLCVCCLLFCVVCCFVFVACR